mmetsp:Transcript_130186/g.337608  ORF Transcript_130186/g.337608 Transcript_130186/m.337608 type:complete len:233 (+) Transcript_130186:2349-3047(+)
MTGLVFCEGGAVGERQAGTWTPLFAATAAAPTGTVPSRESSRAAMLPLALSSTGSLVPPTTAPPPTPLALSAGAGTLPRSSHWLLREVPSVVPLPQPPPPLRSSHWLLRLPPVDSEAPPPPLSSHWLRREPPGGALPPSWPSPETRERAGGGTGGVVTSLPPELVTPHCVFLPKGAPMGFLPAAEPMGLLLPIGAPIGAPIGMPFDEPGIAHPPTPARPPLSTTPPCRRYTA